ncbi:MAG: DUF1963 domain-containing protein [Ruminococcus sp.]|nr:DUF1963 domain-containing protein [Ruminococcus sp.]
MSLLLWLFSESQDTPKVDFIDTVLVFVMFIVSGIFMLIAGLRYGKTEYIPVNLHFLTRIPELPSDEDMKKLINAVKEQSRKEAILIKMNPDKDISVFDSKLGGLPYWDLSRPYPVDSYGTKMVMLAQFNLSKLPENDVFPEKGILQFFLPVYCDYDECKVIYHESIDNSLTEDDIKSLDIPDSLSDEDLFFTGESGMEFMKTTVPINPSDSSSDILMHDMAEKLGISIDKTLRFYEIYTDDEEYEEPHSYESFLLGYPFFINYDTRPDDNKYNTLLFQTGSVKNSELDITCTVQFK